MQSNAKQSKAMQSNAEQFKAAQSKAQQCKVMQSNAKLCTARYSKAKKDTARGIKAVQLEFKTKLNVIRTGQVKQHKERKSKAKQNFRLLSPTRSARHLSASSVTNCLVRSQNRDHPRQGGQPRAYTQYRSRRSDRECFRPSV